MSEKRRQPFNDRLTMRLPHDLALQLHVYSVFTGRPKYEVLTDALAEYFDAHREPGMEQLKALLMQGIPKEEDPIE